METGVSKFRLFNNLDSSSRLFMPFWLLLDMGFVYLGLCTYVHVCVYVRARAARVPALLHVCTSARGSIQPPPRSKTRPVAVSAEGSKQKEESNEVSRLVEVNSPASQTQLTLK